MTPGRLPANVIVAPNSPGLLLLGVGDPARVLLAVREGHAVEGRLGFRVCGKRCRERLGHLNLARRRIEFHGHVNLVTGLGARALAHLLAQAQQELAAHADHGRAPRVPVDGRHDRESLGAFAHGRDLGVVEDHGRCGTTGLQLRLEVDYSHAPILAQRAGLPLRAGLAGHAAFRHQAPAMS